MRDITQEEFVELVLSWLCLVGKPAVISSTIIEQLLDTNSEIRRTASEAANTFFCKNRHHLVVLQSQLSRVIDGRTCSYK